MHLITLASNDPGAGEYLTLVIPSGFWSWCCCAAG